jgi:hypothetical protein
MKTPCSRIVSAIILLPQLFLNHFDDVRNQMIIVFIMSRKSFRINKKLNR